MISLSTGLPGAGKTLYTIAFVKALAEKENRPVFYSGINDLALPWQEVDPEKWFECQPGSIIVIDECQRIFRPRGSGAKVPDFVSRLETHRHDGLDIFLITQHPMLMDANVRRLTERHWHISRRFGMQRATIFQFESCKEQPLSNTSTAQRLDWKYPKEVYGYYKSAEVHTVKRRLPVQYFVMFLVPVLVIALIWYFIQRHYQDGQIVIPGAQTAPKSDDPVEHVNRSASSSKSADKPKAMTTAEYVQAYKPRIDGLAYTAPIYDEVTKPEEPPVPVACIRSKSRGCKCYSQQGTSLEMPDEMCRQIVDKGFFVAFEINKLETRRRQQQDQLAAKKDPMAAPVVVDSPAMPPVDPVRVAAVGNDSTNPRFNPSVRPN